MTGRRSNGEGTIRQRPDGRWEARWVAQDGRRRSCYAQTRQEAARALREALDRVDKDEAPVESAESFEVVAERWRRTARVRQGIKLNSLAAYSTALRLHVYPAIGRIRMRDLKASHVAEVLAAMQDKGLSQAYGNTAHKAISNVCAMAVTDGLMRTNPARAIKVPRAAPAPKVVPTRDQVAAMIAACDDERMKTLLVVLSRTGMRIGECLALSWTDWHGDTLRVTASTKGGKPRAVPVSPALAEQLKAWRKELAAERLAAVWWDDSRDLILPTPVGTPWDPSNARKRFRPIAAAACPGATPHSLRHATATLLLEEGVPLKVVSELLGHSDIRITAGTYSHVSARVLASAASALDNAIG